MKKEHYLLTAFLLFAMFSLAQQTFQKIDTYNGPVGIRKKVSELKAISAARGSETSDSPILRREFRLSKYENFKKEIKTTGNENESLQEETNDLDENTDDAVTTEAVLPSKSKTQQIWSNFLAATFGETPFRGWPPDPSGDAGPNQVVVLTNFSIKAFDKRNVTDEPLVTPRGISNTPAPAQFFLTLRQFFSPLLQPGSVVGDPHVRFDRLTRRWFVIAIDFSYDLVFLAVSDGERIADASSFIYYRFPGAIFTFNRNVPFPPIFDFPTLGVDRNAVLIGGNNFFIDSSFNVDSVYFIGYAIDKRRVIRGQSLLINVLRLGFETPTTSSGMWAPQGVYNDDPLALKSFFAGLNFTLNGIVLTGLTYNASGQLTAVSQTTVPVEQFQFPRDVTAPGSPMPIDPNDVRLLQASIQKNKLTGKSSLWTAHAIGVNQSGHFVSAQNFVQQARTAARWYEIDSVYTRPLLSQLGTLYDSTQPSGRRAVMYFNPSIAASGQGHAVLGGTTAAFNRYLNVFVAGRYNDDAPGTLHNPKKPTRSTAIYAPTNAGEYVDRWGDFSQTIVDPLDNQTIWTFQEYANADDSYGTRAVQLKAPPPATPLPLGTLSNRADTTITIKGISVNHSGFFDPGPDPGGPGYNRLMVKSTGNIIVGEIKFISPTEISIKLNIRGKAAGKYTLIIINPDGQLVTLDYTISGSSENTSIVANTTINEEVAQDFITRSNVFPNPTRNEFRLVVDAAKNMTGKVALIDISGKQIFEKRVNFNQGNNSILLSLGKYNDGTYIALVYNLDNSVIAAHKIVKK
ncbi:MAG: T9SS type A sorting domain-containing protein [Flavisolibacter sp.]|nr:T9SS type A sorting domain-containing protein [Flavisolibacter sp.]